MKFIEAEWILFTLVEDFDLEHDNDFKSLHYNLYVVVPMLDY